MNSSTIELQVTPSASELYAVIDVLVAVGLDLERRDDRGAGAQRTGEPLTREREGLGVALCMLGQLIARQSAPSVRNTSAAGFPMEEWTRSNQPRRFVAPDRQEGS